jgi:hypothetical protein
MISDHGRGTADYARKTRRRGAYWYHPHPEKAGNPAERCNHKGLTRQENRQEPGRNWQVTRQVAVISDQSGGVEPGRSLWGGMSPTWLLPRHGFIDAPPGNKTLTDAVFGRRVLKPVLGPDRWVFLSVLRASVVNSFDRG